MTDLGATLKNTSLLKKDLELELEELEEAATMVVEEQEEQEERQGAYRSAPIPGGDSSSYSSDSSSSSSSSDSSDESEESDAEGQGCTDSKKGGGGETFKDNPLQQHPTSTTAAAAANAASPSPIPQEPTVTFLSAGSKVEALPSASESSRQLIQELGERVAEEMRISQDSHSSRKAEGNCSQLSGGTAETEGTSAMSSSSGTLLEPSPRRNPLLIVQTQEDPDESIFICGNGT